MGTYTNDEFFKIAGSKEVTVSVTFILDEKANENLAIRNAAEALRFFANSNPRQHSSWVKKIEVKR